MSPPPNLFLVGGPKCGTTALTRYLGAQPGVFAPDTADQHPFGSDLDFRHGPRTPQADWQARYAGAASAQDEKAELTEADKQLIKTIRESGGQALQLARLRKQLFRLGGRCIDLTIRVILDRSPGQRRLSGNDRLGRFPFG